MERQQGMEEKRGSRNEELGVLVERRVEVGFLNLCFSRCELIVFDYIQLDEKIKGMGEELGRAKQELENQQAERSKIAYVVDLFCSAPVDIDCLLLCLQENGSGDG